MIREKSETLVRRGECSIVEVEISRDRPIEGALGGREFVPGGWEFHCDACDAYSTGLSEPDANDELSSHTCPADPRAPRISKKATRRSES